MIKPDRVLSKAAVTAQIHARHAQSERAAERALRGVSPEAPRSRGSISRLFSGSRPNSCRYGLGRVRVHALPFAQAVVARPLDGRDMHERVGTATIRLNEPIAFGGVEPLHSSGLQRTCPHVRRRLRRATTPRRKAHPRRPADSGIPSCENPRRRRAQTWAKHSDTTRTTSRRACPSSDFSRSHECPRPQSQPDRVAPYSSDGQMRQGRRAAMPAPVDDAAYCSMCCMPCSRQAL